ncbi:MAG: DUF4278 domain-containing protein [Cyanobacteria bacterium CRU_2_1]|nr:DUF4278 domain-containing protein [Cyanobacteria bacterium RU_5_0]NJR61151.1 DUF4278 domain-containing protein [Cyanobacteria bacterium CRU_2_1]
MKLIYRGVTYDYNPPTVNYGDLSQSDKYQGVDIRFRNRKKPLVLPSTLKLIYRGHTYNPADVAKVENPQVNAPKTLIYRGHTYTINPATPPVNTAKTVEVAEVKASTPSVQEQARHLMMDHHRAIKRRQQSMLVRLDTKVGLPADEATRYWNHIKGETHPSFVDSYDRSHVAFS